MPRSTICPAFKTAVEKTIKEHEATRHFMEGGRGASCYIWVTGPGVTPKGNPSKRRFEFCVGSNCLDMKGIDAALAALPGYGGHHINLD